MKVTLLVPVRNEINGMRKIMPRIDRAWVDDILVLDGGSTDGSVEYAEQQGCRVYRQKSPGMRSAYIESYDLIDADIVITFSPDGNSIPELIPDLVRKMRIGYDMVIVSRYLEKAKSDDDTALTKIGNYVFTLMINVLFGGKYTDAMVMFRAWRRSLPRDVGLTECRSGLYERVLGRFISWEPQLSARSALRKLRVAEISGDEPPRIAADGEVGGGVFFPASRISHVKVGLACLLVLIGDFVISLFGRSSEDH